MKGERNLFYILIPFSAMIKQLIQLITGRPAGIIFLIEKMSDKKTCAGTDTGFINISLV